MKTIQRTFSFLLVAFVVVECICADDYCYSKDKKRPQSLRYASKTAYQLVKPSKVSGTIKNCAATNFWLLNRHGTRLPSASIISEAPKLELLRDEIVALNKNNKASYLCSGDLKLLEKWKWDRTLTPDMDQYLTKQGYADLKGIGSDYKKAFSKLITKKYDATKYEFRRTNTERAEMSYRAFTEAWFGKNAYQQINLPPAEEVDTFLKPYDHCDPFDERRKDSEEEKIFRESFVYEKVIEEVSKKFGFEVPLNISLVELMFEICRFEQAWEPKKASPWCIGFNYEQVEVLEYAEDLNHYYKGGYGFPQNKFLMCEAFQDLYKKMNEPDQKPISAYFAHETTVQLFLVLMDAARDANTLKADNFAQMRDRKWKSSQIGPFATHVAVVKYECKDSADKIAFFQNERPLEFNWCPGGVCPLEAFSTQFKDYMRLFCEMSFCQE